MKVTDIRVYPVDEERLKAYVTIIFDDCFVVRDLRIINGNKGLFVAMPTRKRKDGTFKDVAHPLNSETRQMLEEVILKEYDAALQQRDRDNMVSSSRGRTEDFLQ